jgi:aminoglycoside phosphotransferase (APT) family kinase protein
MSHQRRHLSFSRTAVRSPQESSILIVVTMDAEEQLKIAIAELSKTFRSEFSTPPSLPLSGCNNLVYLINYHGEAWALRIPKDEISALIGRRGTAMLRHLNKMRPDLQVPRLIHESESRHYTVMQYLPGKTINSWSSVFLSEERRHQLLDSLATFLLEPWTCPVAETGVFPLSLPMSEI